jgi:large subunit ribosomal protein L15
MNLHTLKPSKGSQKANVRRVGRGPGSGRGKTAGRGTKGQKARTGGRRGLKRLGMKAVISRIPKLRGFRSQYPGAETVTLRQLVNAMPKGGAVTPAELAKRGLASAAKVRVKLVGGDELKAKYAVKGCLLSAGAKAAIEKAGGSVA